MKTRLLQSASILLTFLSLVGCASRFYSQDNGQADAQKKTQEEPAKAGIPTFTYRPGA